MGIQSYLTSYATNVLMFVHSPCSLVSGNEHVQTLALAALARKMESHRMKMRNHVRMR